MIADRVVVAHDLDLLAGTTGSTLSANGGTSALAFCRSSSRTRSCRNVARLREGRHPAAVFEPRVPADVIDMQMRAHDEVDVGRRKAGGGERAHIGVVGLDLHFGRSGRGLSLPMQLSIRMVWCGVFHHIGLEAQDQRILCSSSAPAFCIHDRFSVSSFRRQARQHLQSRQEGWFPAR